VLNNSNLLVKFVALLACQGYIVHLTLVVVKKVLLAKRLAKKSGISTAAAADQLDGILSGILRRVRQGHSASLPGLGTFLPGPKPQFYFEECLPSGAWRAKAPRASKAAKMTKAPR
jgi:hypothetical protein